MLFEITKKNSVIIILKKWIRKFEKPSLVLYMKQNIPDFL